MKKRIQTIQILIFALTFHVFWVNIKLLYDLNFVDGTADSDPSAGFSKEIILAALFALSYSIATISVIRLTKRSNLITTYAVLDSVGVLLYYFEEIPDPVRAIYFAAYTFILIRSTIFLDNPEYISEQILEMKDRGITQREIAKKLNLSETKVSRIINRNKDEAA